MESRSQGTGAIIADNGLEYLILTERKLVAGADHISATFHNLSPRIDLLSVVIES